MKSVKVPLRRAARGWSRGNLLRVLILLVAFGCGLLGGVLIAALRLAEYRFLVLEHSLEIYGGIVAVLFSALGIWLGLKLTRVKTVEVVREVPVTGPFVRNEARVAER